MVVHLVVVRAEDVEVSVHAQGPEGGGPHREGHLDRDLARHGGGRLRSEARTPRRGGCFSGDVVHTRAAVARGEDTRRTSAFYMLALMEPPLAEITEHPLVKLCFRRAIAPRGEGNLKF
eukprot:scaffold24842_cov44-Phaeocystis_antarctica.AAC.2